MPWWLYPAFGVVVLALLTIDLRLHREDRPTTFRSAAIWTAVWISLALAFAYGLTHYSRQLSLEFLAGYVVEESLSVDNMFVFALVFRYFAVPGPYQHRVLFYGVLGAMIFRGIFIAAGTALVRFEWVLVLFGIFLIYTGLHMAFEKEKEIRPEDSAVVRFARRFFPVTPDYHGSRFFVTLDGVRWMTPLAIVLLFLETTDLMFAVESVPAVFGVTREPFIVYTSNIFAILGLRSMFFLLAGALDKFYLLKHGLAAVLVFVGLKMVWLDHAFGGRFPIVASLCIIGALLATAILLSLVDRALLARRVAGVVFLFLAIAGFLYAAGPGHAILELPALTELGAPAVCWSAACSLLCAALLLSGIGLPACPGERSSPGLPKNPGPHPNARPQP